MTHTPPNVIDELSSGLLQRLGAPALNGIRTASRGRETDVGEWLPEPEVTSPDEAADYELAKVYPDRRRPGLLGHDAR